MKTPGVRVELELQTQRWHLTWISGSFPRVDGALAQTLGGVVLLMPLKDTVKVKRDARPRLRSKCRRSVKSSQRRWWTMESLTHLTLNSAAPPPLSLEENFCPTTRRPHASKMLPTSALRYCPHYNTFMLFYDSKPTNLRTPWRQLHFNQQEGTSTIVFYNNTSALSGMVHKNLYSCHEGGRVIGSRCDTCGELSKAPALGRGDVEGHMNTTTFILSWVIFCRSTTDVIVPPEVCGGQLAHSERSPSGTDTNTRQVLSTTYRALSRHVFFQRLTMLATQCLAGPPTPFNHHHH